MREEPQKDTTTSGGNDTGLFPWVAWTLFLLFVAYPLSVAPAVKFLGPSPHPTVRVIYAPLRFLYNQSQPVRSFYDWYAKVWGVRL